MSRQPVVGGDNGGWGAILNDYLSQSLASDGTQIHTANGIANVKEKLYGAKGDGATDDTVAVQAAISSGLPVYFPPGQYKITSTLTLPKGTALMGAGPASQNTNSGTGAFLNHAFNGILLQLDGSGSLNPGGGYMIRNLTLVQTSGTGATTAGVGTAIRIVGTSANTRATWVRIENVQIEEGVGNDPWTTCIDIDGSGCNGLGVTNTVRDIWISNGRIQNSATTGTPNGLKSTFAANVFLLNLEVTGAGGNITLTGSGGNLTSSVNMTFVQAVTLALDFCQNVMEYGGQYTSITNTANTAGSNMLFPLSVTNSITNTAPLTTAILQFQKAAAISGVFNQALNIGTPILFGNGNNGGLGALNATSTAYFRIISLNGSNQVDLGLDADTRAGALTSFMVGTVSGKGQGTINVQNGYYANGSSGVTKTGVTSTFSAMTITNGIITAVTT